MSAAPPGPIRFAVVIPVYNHGRTLKQVVTAALAVHEAVIVVDDGSTDGGVAALADLPVTVIRHAVNRGKGAALVSAAATARRQGMTHMIALDADGQHVPGDIGHFLPLMAADPLAIIVGARVFAETGVPGLTRFGRRFSNFWFRVQTGSRVSDTQSGFRAYPLLLFERLTLRENRYAFEVEVLVRAAWAGFPVREVAIRVHYPPGDSRVSHFRLWHDNLQISLLNTRLTLRAMLPVPHRLVVDPDGRRKGISIWHPLAAIRQLLQQELTPRHLAVSGALGVFLGALPLIALHTVVILFAAGYLRLNKITALATSQLCMPPIVPALCIEAGFYLRNGHFLTEISLKTIGYQAVDRLLEWVLGAMVVAPVLAFAIGAAIYLAALVTQVMTADKTKVG